MVDEVIGGTQVERVVYIGTAEWDELVAAGDGVEGLAERMATLDRNDPINIQYTSGTTGFPKGATLSHRNILNNGYFTTELINFTENDRLAIPVPFYHCFGMVMGNLGCIVTRGDHGDPGARLRPCGHSAGRPGREVHRRLRCADDVHRDAERARLRQATTCRRCAPGSWPARPARSR